MNFLSLFECVLTQDMRSMPDVITKAGLVTSPRQRMEMTQSTWQAHLTSNPKLHAILCFCSEMFRLFFLSLLFFSILSCCSEENLADKAAYSTLDWKLRERCALLCLIMLNLRARSAVATCNRYFYWIVSNAAQAGWAWIHRRKQKKAPFCLHFSINGVFWP